MIEKNEMIWVRGYNGNANMGFNVTKEVKEYIDSRGIDYMYSREGIQKQLDDIQTYLDSQKNE